MQSISHVAKKSKAVTHEVMIREDRNNAQSLSKVVNDATIFASSAFPMSMIDNILPFLSPQNLFIFMTTIEICQKHLTHELVVKAVINYFRQLTTEHANYVTTINSLNTISYLCAIIRSIHIPSLVRLLHMVNGQICEFCLTHPLDSLDNPFGMFSCQTCLGYESEIDLIQVCDLKKGPFSSHMRIWSPNFGHINTTFLQETDDVLFCWRSNCED